jgi:hypothetical protein
MNNPKPLMQKSEPTDLTSLKYHADAQLLSGHLSRPVELKIEGQAQVSLEDRGGYLYRITEDFSAEELISFKSGYTRAAGYHSPQQGWVTLATAVLERLNVLDVITAERIVAQVSTALSGFDGREPSVTFLGTRFENLRICGCPVDVDLDLGICSPKPSDGQRYLDDLRFLDRVESQFESTRDTSGLPDWFKRYYEDRIGSIDHLRKFANGRERAEEQHRQLRCSLVKSIAPIPIRGVKTFGNSILVPDFGALMLGEVVVGELQKEEQILTYFDLTMLHVEMGSIAEGGVGVAKIRLDGGARPFVGGSGGGWELGEKETGAVPPGLLQEYAAVSSPVPRYGTVKKEAEVLVPPTEAQLVVGQNRHINAWIADGEPPLEKGRSYKFAINVGKLCEHAIAAPKLREFDWKDNHELDVWIVLSGYRVKVEPCQQKFTLPKEGDTDTLFFAITPTGYGSVLLRVSLYFARELTLLQEFEVPIPVKESVQVA